jgi:hypothetical protein
LSEQPAALATRRGLTAAAVLIALVAWIGLGLNFADAYGRTESILATIWTLLDYFTITTNLLIAVYFTALLSHPQAALRPKLVGGLALSILLVGIVNQLLLQGLYNLTPVGFAADVLLHRFTPVLVPLFWLAFAPKGALRLWDPLGWALYPIGYFAYALLRGVVGGHYPYPFMNMATIGWAQTAINAAVIAFGFIVTGAAAVWLDAILAGRSTPRL